MARQKTRSKRRAGPSPEHARPELAVAVPRQRRGILALIAILVVTAIAYAPALKAPFQFDDIASITENPTIWHLWPPSAPLHPPAGSAAVSGRPVVNYSLAVNHAINDALGIEQGLESEGPWKTVSYHVVNILLHLACGVLLFGIVRRTLRQERLAAEWAGVSEVIALAVTGLWLLHPIQTEAVNYVVQRTELIVSACYLGTLYASIRASAAERRNTRVAWYAVGVVTCLVGMGSKEVMLTAPLAVMLYDRAFRLDSWRDLLSTQRGRAWFYLALAATGALSISLIASGPRTGTVGFHLGMPWYQYFYSQAWAISHYLTLVPWPHPLIIDYGQDPVTGLGGVPGLILLTVFGVATVVAWTQASRWGWFGFLGAWFFMLLAPSSSFVPIVTEIAAERRIYLALAAVFVLIVVGAELFRRRLARRRGAGQRSWPGAVRLGWGLGVVGLLLAGGTFERSVAYAHPESLWTAVVARAPRSARAYAGSGYALLLSDASRLGDADHFFRQAVVLDSTYLPAWRSLTVIAMKEGRLDDARKLLEHELAIDPNYPDAVARMGQVLSALGAPDRAIPYLERATASDLTEASLMALATAYLATGRPQDAESALRRVLERAPTRADAMRFMGDALLKQGRAAEAVPYLENAAAREPGSGFGLALLSVAYAESARVPDAAAAAAAAIAASDREPIVYLLTGQAMVRAKRYADAERYLAALVRLVPDDPVALTEFGSVEAVLGKRDEAMKILQRAVALAPAYAPARDALANLGHRG